MDSHLMLGITFTRDTLSVIINNEVGDSILGEAFAELTMVLKNQRPEALGLAAKILEDNND